MRTMIWKSLGVALLMALVTVPGLRATEADGSLYERLGGQPAVRAVVSGLVDRILSDSRVNKWFAHAASSPENAAAYKVKLSDFVCQATGGPCKYAGPDMVSAHKGRAVTGEAFDAVVQDLVAVLVECRPRKGRAARDLGPLKASSSKNSVAIDAVGRTSRGSCWQGSGVARVPCRLDVPAGSTAAGNRSRTSAERVRSADQRALANWGRSSQSGK